MTYSVFLSPGAERDLGALDKPVQRRVVARIEALAANPRPAGVTKLQGEANAWRIRVGDYRVLYTIEDGRLVVLVIKIGHLTMDSSRTAVSIAMANEGSYVLRLSNCRASIRQPAILAYVDAHNEDAKPFKWTKTADENLNKVRHFGLRTQHVHAE